MTGKIKFPRRRISRYLVKILTRIAFKLFTNLEIIGKENIPTNGPLIVVGNHFNFADPAAMIRVLPSCTEFFSGANPVFAPGWAKNIPKLWGVLYVYRGTGSRKALQSAEVLLSQKGILGVFPEAGSWAHVLRPPRPGSAYIASRTEARILPMGIYGFKDVFPLRLWKKAKVTIKIGEPFGPFTIEDEEKMCRETWDNISDQIMFKIAELLPPESRGRYSDDPDLRQAAKAVSEYPWANGKQTDLK